MTLLISLEFLSSIVNILKYHDIRKLLEDVVLISGLAIARKLIVYDYDKHNMEDLIGISILFLSIGLFYFLIRKNRRGEMSDD